MKTFNLRSGLRLFSFIFAILLPVFGRAASVTVDCSGGTPGAFTSLQAAIDSLDVVGPHVITLAPQSCQENVQIVNRQRLTINAAPTGVFIGGKTGAGDVMTIAGSTGITLIQVGFRAGSRGVFVDRESEVAILGTTVEMNSGAGVGIAHNSNVVLEGLIQNNGGDGINVYSSVVNIRSGSQVLNNSGAGVYANRSRVGILGNVIQNNNNGVYLENGSAGEVDAPSMIQNNRNSGVIVDEGSSVQILGSVDSNGAPVANVISGNPSIGLDIYSGTARLQGPNQISNNGSGNQLLHAGVRVDLNASLITAGSGDVKINGNTGPGIDATTGGNVLLSGTVVTGNSGDGVRLRGNGRVVILQPNTNMLTGNQGQPVNCDRTSVFVGDPTGFAELECPIVRPSGP